MGYILRIKGIGFEMMSMILWIIRDASSVFEPAFWSELCTGYQMHLVRSVLLLSSVHYVRFTS